MRELATPIASEHGRPSGLTTGWLTALLIGATVVELCVLRIGTRTAIHIPGIEMVRAPYLVAASTGRLAFYVAAVVLAVLVWHLGQRFRRCGDLHVMALIAAFAAVAVLGAVHLVGGDATGPAVVVIVAVLATIVVVREPGPVGIAVALFAAAFVLAGTASVLQDHVLPISGGAFRELMLRSEQLAVLGAILSGPLVRRRLKLGVPSSLRLVSATAMVGLTVTAAAIANPSTMNILMLWNFGLIGTMPAVAYGLAAASLAMAIGSAARHGAGPLAQAIALLTIGGIGLISTYQSGLVVVGLALLLTTTDRRVA